MQITGIILSGGKSSRMGQDKGMMEYRGKKLIEYSIELLSPFCQELLVSSNSPDYHSLGCRVVPDNFKDSGPIAGLEATLTKSSNNMNLVVSCDSPFIEPVLFEKLIEQFADQDVIIPIHEKGIEPLIGIYQKRLSVFFYEKIIKGDLKVQKIIRECDLDFFDAELLLSQYPNLFKNLNSKEDVNL